MLMTITTLDYFFLMAALAVASAGFVCYYFLPLAKLVQSWFRPEKQETMVVLFQRLLGSIIFGILPLVIIQFSEGACISQFGIKGPVNATWYWSALLSAAVVVLNLLNASHPANLAMYPQVREKEWSVKLVVASALTWILYLIGYEFLFRGFLLFAALAVMGLWPAIVLNTSIYMLVHLPKGIKETVGAIPLGVLLCYLTLQTGSIWIAVIVHIVMALSNEWLSLRAQPGMTVKFWKP
jgi:membrane protease YdiL (CAAX protease family)